MIWRVYVCVCVRAPACLARVRMRIRVHVDVWMRTCVWVSAVCVLALQGDEILQVNEHRITRRTGVEAVTAHIRGPIGSLVTMRMRKPDGFSLNNSIQAETERGGVAHVH